jgi:hypothetical protein
MKIQRRKCCLRLNPYPHFLPPLEAAALRRDLPYEILYCRTICKNNSYSQLYALLISFLEKIFSECGIMIDHSNCHNPDHSPEMSIPSKPILLRNKGSYTQSTYHGLRRQGTDYSQGSVAQEVESSPAFTLFTVG